MNEKRPLVDPKSMTLAESWLGERNGETEHEDHVWALANDIQQAIENYLSYHDLEAQ